LIYHNTPIQEIHSAALDKAGVRLLVKREDLNHPAISGNKWWKLKYNLEEANLLNKNTVLTFGGAFSNHIYATASAAKEHHLGSIGIIRGEETLPLNATLGFARQNGMLVHYVSREAYRKKNDTDFINKLTQTFGDFYLIPEGGTNVLAVKGCAEYARKELASITFDQLYLAVGTGGTMAGLIAGFEGKKKIIGIPVLKNADFLNDSIQQLAQAFKGETYNNWSLLTAYHHGGYARVTKELMAFIASMKDLHNLPLDHVYTGKLMWAVMKELERGSFSRGTTIMVLHSGGLQGTITDAQKDMQNL
jgi:1-aminocyclopropane-1-carboxylate deaminase/D-cysteine desulfhydrase-like pyridoxal-dependent ACC family enzyme